MRNCEAEGLNISLKRGWVILPAVLLGIIAMIADGVSAALWGMQIAAYVIFGMLGMLRRAAQKVSSVVWSALMLIALTATLCFPAVQGARRWLYLGMINVNAAMLVLPGLIALINGMKQPHWAMMLATAVLCLQPDLSQLAALSAAVLPVLWKQRKNMYWTIASVALLVLFFVRGLTVPIALESVAYCEGILGLLGNISPIIQIVGIASLALIPGYFLYRCMKNRSAVMMSLAIYYAVTILFSFAGAYPVPFMGYGLSPIAGYWLAGLFFTSENDYL